MTPRQLKAAFNLHAKHTNKHESLAIRASYILLFLVFPVVIVLLFTSSILHELMHTGDAVGVISLVLVGIFCLCVQLICSSLVAHRIIEPRTKVGDYRVTRETLQNWAGIVLLISGSIYLVSISQQLQTATHLIDVLFASNVGWMEAKLHGGQEIVVRTTVWMSIIILCATAVIVWVRGYFTVKNMLSARRIRGHNSEEIFQ